jgi:gliding motility-associated-like protein
MTMHATDSSPQVAFRYGLIVLLSCLSWSGFGQITFTDVPGLDFLDSESYLRGVSWTDVDGDHDLDVCVTGAGGTFPDFVNKSAIFINDGAGNFTNTGLLVSTQDNAMGHGWADYDNDGDPDLYIGATWNSGGVNEFWVNENGLSLSQVTNSGATTGGAQPFEGSVSWADFDLDGFVDLYLPRWNDQTDRLFRNNGDGTFTLVTGMAPVTDGAWTSAGVWGDYDNDHDPDLYVANYQFGSNGPGVNRLYQNNGDGTFTQVAGAGEVVTDGQGTRSANWVDVNNDGWLDLFAANQGNPTTGSDGLDKLYLNNGDGTFSTQVIGPDQTSWTSNWGDYDNDGDLDLITISLWGDDAKLWANDGTGNFTDVSAQVGDVFPLATSGSWANAAIFVDFDQDGWLDLHITQPDATDDHLFRNEGEDCRSWLELELVGQVSNRSAIGARAQAKATIDGGAVWQLREVSAQTSKPGQNPLWLHFGFGGAAIIDSLVITWPTGNACVFTNVAVNQFLSISEDCNTEVIIAAPPVVGSSQTQDLCGTSDDVSLDAPSGPGGTWSASCGNCIDQNGLFLASTLSAGTYEVFYNQGGICGTTDTIVVNLQEANAGADAEAGLCIGEESVDLFGALGGNPAIGGYWLNPLGDTVEMPTDPFAGIFFYIQGDMGCVDTSEVEVFFVASSNPFSETITIAPGETVELDAGPGETYSWEPTTGLSCVDCQQPVFSGEESTSYSVTVEDAFGCVVVHTIEVVIDVAAAYDVPNAFSPNGDGTNDTFGVVADEGTFTAFSLQVYSRWGQLVFETADPTQGWDGQFQGESAPSDVYVYQLVFTLKDGVQGSESGEIVLLR